jgi:hypothetical protein
MAGLTQKQRRLIGSIEEITDELALDHQALVTNLKGVELTTMLELAVRRLVSSAIVFEYTFIDELLGTIIGVYFEGARGGRQAWQTKRFQRFNDFVLERLYLLEKLEWAPECRSSPSLSLG